MPGPATNCRQIATLIFLLMATYLVSARYILPCASAILAKQSIVLVVSVCVCLSVVRPVRAKTEKTTDVY